MDTELERLQQAKMYMDYLANGIDPVTNADVDTDTLHHEAISTCFRYIADILARNIYEVESNIKHSRADFFITEEQCAQLQPNAERCIVTTLANEINRVTEQNDTKKLSATWINDWLEAEGYLYKSELKSRMVTDTGKLLGITSEYRQRHDGSEYYLNFYTEQAQRFVFDHIREIVAHHNQRHAKTEKEMEIQTIAYPPRLPVRKFIGQYPEQCFILSMGSCDSVAGIGSYIAVLLYKGRSRVLKKTNIPSNSTNQCILTGIIEAASAIKMPTDVIILTATPVGFHSPKSRNYRLCQEIYQILSDKECSITEAVCMRMGNDLNKFIKSLGE